MKNLKASDVMIRPVVSVRKHAGLRDVVLQLTTGLYSGLPVTDEKGSVIGIITELDILNALSDGKELVRMTVEDIMSQDVTTAHPDTPIKEIIEIMKEWKFIRLPIVDQGGKLVGIVARCDIIKASIEPEFVTYM